MIRIVRLLVLALIALVLVVIAVANREPVDLHVLPLDAGSFLGYSWTIRLPLFLVIFAGILAGVALGFVWEWLRERRIRSEAVRAKRDVARLSGEVDRLRVKADEHPKDEVLALLDRSAR